MAYADAKDRLVTMLEAVTLTSVGHGVPGKLHHVKTSTEEAPARSRGFRIETQVIAIQGGTLHPSSPRRQRRVDGEIVVDYEPLADRDAFDRMVVSDFEAIADYVTDTGNWNRPASTIETLNLLGADEESISPGSIEVDNNGRARLRVPFTLVYTHAAS